MFRDEKLPSRFWDKVKIQDSGCWDWTASVSRQTGYGWYRVEGKSLNAHRVSCTAFHGINPREKPFAMHSCDNRKCVNPKHLKWGSPGDNSRDMARKGRGVKPRVTHCPQGHEFTEDNTYIPPGQTSRRCRECHRRWWREWNVRRNEPGYKPARLERIRANRGKSR